MAKFLVRCPACDSWETPTFESPFEADEAMRDHAREVHPDWPEPLHFRRETVV